MVTQTIKSTSEAAETASLTVTLDCGLVVHADVLSCAGGQPMTMNQPEVAPEMEFTLCGIGFEVPAEDLAAEAADWSEQTGLSFDELVADPDELWHTHADELIELLSEAQRNEWETL